MRVTAPPQTPTTVKPYAYGRISFFGRIGADQSWSTGWSFTNTGTPSSQNLMDLLAYQVSQECDLMWNGNNQGVGAASLNAQDTTMTGVRAYWYPAGTNKASAQGEFIYSAPRVGTGTASLPTQTSVVVSTLSGNPGRANRGRMYLPATGATLNGHQLVLAPTGQFTTQIGNALTNFNLIDSAVGDYRCVIASAQAPIPIVRVRVDTRPDIQRRRADKVFAYGFSQRDVANS